MTLISAILRHGEKPEYCRDTKQLEARVILIGLEHIILLGLARRGKTHAEFTIDGLQKFAHGAQEPAKLFSPRAVIKINDTGLCCAGCVGCRDESRCDRGKVRGLISVERYKCRGFFPCRAGSLCNCGERRGTDPEQRCSG